MIKVHGILRIIVLGLFIVLLSTFSGNGNEALVDELKELNKLYQEGVLTKEELANIKKLVAEKLLTTDNRPWITFPDAFKKIDDLRQEDNADKKFLNDYDLFLQGLQAKHEQNI